MYDTETGPYPGSMTVFPQQDGEAQSSPRGSVLGAELMSFEGSVWAVPVSSGAEQVSSAERPS